MSQMLMTGHVMAGIFVKEMDLCKACLELLQTRHKDLNIMKEFEMWCYWRQACQNVLTTCLPSSCKVKDHLGFHAYIQHSCIRQGHSWGLSEAFLYGMDGCFAPLPVLSITKRVNLHFSLGSVG